jgi:hypothetical protein
MACWQKSASRDLNRFSLAGPSYAKSSRSRIFVGIGVVLLPPRLLARVPGRLGEDKRLRLRGGVLEDPEMIVVEDAQRFDGIRDGDAAVPDEQEVLSVLGIGR